MKKLGVQIIAFNEKRLIIPSILQYEGIADKVVVGVSKKPWFGDIKPDSTYYLAKTTQAEVYSGEWKTEKDQRNFLMDKLQDVDYVIVLNPDGFMTKESFNNIKKFIQKEDGDIYGSHTLTYWKNYDTIIQPDWDHQVMLIKKDVRFEYANRTFNHRVDVPKIPGVTVHHLSWVKTDEEILTKIQTFTHAPEIIKDWYNKTWKNWDNTMTNFAPTTPTDFKYTINYPLPNEIRKLIYENQPSNTTFSIR